MGGKEGSHSLNNAFLKSPSEMGDNTFPAVVELTMTRSHLICQSENRRGARRASHIGQTIQSRIHSAVRRSVRFKASLHGTLTHHAKRTMLASFKTHRPSVVYFKLSFDDSELFRGRCTSNTNFTLILRRIEDIGGSLYSLCNATVSEDLWKTP